MALSAERRTRMTPDRRRTLLLGEARRLFGSRGYAGTRIEDVATAAGVTKPMVYRHFESKEELYLALLAKHEADLPTFTEDADPEVDADELIRGILDGWLDYARTNSDSWLMLFRDHSGGERIEAARTRVSAHAQEVMATFLAQHTGHLEPESVAPVAAILTSGLAGLILWWVDHPDVPKATVVDAATRATGAILAG